MGLKEQVWLAGRGEEEGPKFSGNDVLNTLYGFDTMKGSSTFL